MTEIASQVGRMTQVMALKASGWAYIEALGVAADSDRTALAREDAGFVGHVVRIVRV